MVELRKKLSFFPLLSFFFAVSDQTSGISSLSNFSNDSKGLMGNVLPKKVSSLLVPL